jgi:hypothetical protein
MLAAHLPLAWAIALGGLALVLLANQLLLRLGARSARVYHERWRAQHVRTIGTKVYFSTAVIDGPAIVFMQSLEQDPAGWKQYLTDRSEDQAINGLNQPN